MPSSAAGRFDAIIEVVRLPSGQLDVTYRTAGPARWRAQPARRVHGAVGRDPRLDELVAAGLGARARSRRRRSDRARSQRPVEGGRAVDAVEVASRGFLGTVFIILMFITILIYGMWVATGVATEKSSRVMELMISAASPRQLLVGKVVGIGGAGLTQYVAIAVPAVLVLAFQDQIAAARARRRWRSGCRRVGSRSGCSRRTACSSCSGSRCSR